MFAPYFFGTNERISFKLGCILHIYVILFLSNFCNFRMNIFWVTLSLRNLKEKSSPRLIDGFSSNYVIINIHLSLHVTNFCGIGWAVLELFSLKGKFFLHPTFIAFHCFVFFCYKLLYRKYIWENMEVIIFSLLIWFWRLRYSIL